jgi:hypothetical protein
MRHAIRFVAILAIFSFTPAFAQIKQWVDEKGIVHYEATGTEKPESVDPNQPKPNTRRTLERNHAGLTLGDNEASFVATKKGDYAGKVGADGNYYRFSGTLPEAAVNMGDLFINGRLALIRVEYHDLGLKGWNQLVKQTAEKYGPPQGDARTAVWSDGTTGLTFKYESSGTITIWLEDLAATSKYSEQERAALPKF